MWYLISNRNTILTDSRGPNLSVTCMSQTSMFCFSDSEISEDSPEDNETSLLTSASGSHLQIPGLHTSPKVRNLNMIKIVLVPKNISNLTFKQQSFFSVSVFWLITSQFYFPLKQCMCFALIATSHNRQGTGQNEDIYWVCGTGILKFMLGILKSMLQCILGPVSQYRTIFKIWTEHFWEFQSKITLWEWLIMLKWIAESDYFCCVVVGTQY